MSGDPRLPSLSERLDDIIMAMRSERPRYKSHDLGFVDSVSSNRIDEWVDELETMLAELARERSAREAAEQEIAEAREACPLVRRQDYFDASLLELVNHEIGQLIDMTVQRDRLASRLRAVEAALREIAAAGLSFGFNSAHVGRQLHQVVADFEPRLQKRLDALSK